MPIAEQEVPRRSHESKYEFPKADVDASIKMLKEGKNPGDGGYEKEGHARSAAAHLIEQIEATKDAPEQVGSRAWKDEDGKWRFALKLGKRKPNEPKK